MFCFAEEMFIYNRAASKDHTLSSFMEEPSLNEEDHEISNGEEDYCCNSTSDFKMPTLDDASQGSFTCRSDCDDHV